MHINRKTVVILGACLVVLGLGTFATLRFFIPALERPPVKLRLEVLSTASIGQPISLKLYVQNTSNRNIEVRLAGDPAHEFVVTKPDGSTVWRSSSGLILVIMTKPIPAHEEIVFETEWDQKSLEGELISPGKYQIQGILHFTDPNYQLQTSKQLTEIR